MRTFLLSLLFFFFYATAYAQFSDGTPAESPENFILAIIDVETTGLEPGQHELVDLGAVYVELDGKEIARFFVRIHPDHPERAGEVARSINGYDEARWAALNAVSKEEAAEAFLKFHVETVRDRTAIFTAYNAYFDRAFIDTFLKERGHKGFRELFSYFLLDLPSLAWGVGIRDQSNAAVARALGLEPETEDPLKHTGMSGALWNLDVYRALTKHSPVPAEN